MCVNSTPVTPEPTTTMCSGSSGGGYAWRVVSTRSPSTGANSGTRGREPVATTMKSASSSSMPWAVSTTTSCGPLSRPVPRRSRTFCDSSSCDDRLVQALLDRRDPLAERVQVDAAFGLQAHHVAAAELGQLAAGGDHRLGGDAVPQVGRAGDDVTLDQRHLCPERGRNRRARVAGGAPAEDRDVVLRRCASRTQGTARL